MKLLATDSRLEKHTLGHFADPRLYADPSLPRGMEGGLHFHVSGLFLGGKILNGKIYAFLPLRKI